MRWFLLPVLFLVTHSPVFAYSSPGQPVGFVNDYAEILTPEQEAVLETKLNTLATSEGSEVAVVTVPDLGGDTLENFAVSLFAEWGIGKKDKDNGLLLLVAVQEREVRIEVGYGLEGTITDAQAYWIIQDVITPAFKSADYYAGISGAVDKVTEAITGGVVLPSSTESRPEKSDLPANVMAGAIYILIALAAFLGKSRSFWFGGVLGAGFGLAGGMFFGSFQDGLIAGGILGALGLLFDYMVSRGGGPGTGLGGGAYRGGFGGSGGGGFGGGRSGGGGASGRW